MEVDVSFLRGYPYTGVVMVACDGLGEFCVVLRAVLFFLFLIFYGLSFLVDFVIFFGGCAFCRILACRPAAFGHVLFFL